MLAGVTDCRRSRKWGCKGRWALGFKPRPGSHRERGPCGFGGEGRGSCSFGKVNRGDHAFLEERKEDHVVLECSLLPRGLGSRRDFAGKKRGERTLAGGP